jgi:hypothetical protein
MAVPMSGRWGGRSASHRGQRMATDVAQRKLYDAEHMVVIKYNGDFDMRGFVQTLNTLNNGSSRSVTIDYEDAPFRSTWDGDGADRIISAEIDGKNALDE